MCGARAPTHLRQNYLFQIFSLDIAAIYQLFLVVGNINANRGQQIGRHNLDAVVVGLGVVDFNFLALFKAKSTSSRALTPGKVFEMFVHA